MIYPCHDDQNANDDAGGAIPGSSWAVEYSLSLPSEQGANESIRSLTARLRGAWSGASYSGAQTQVRGCVRHRGQGVW